MTRTLDNFVQTAESRYASTGHGQKIRRGLESGIRNVSGRWEMMFDLPDRKPIAEFNVYTFLVRQQFENGKVVFQSSTEMREASRDLSANSNEARKSLEEFRKQLLETVDLTPRHEP